MNNKIFVNSSIVTTSWKEAMGKVFIGFSWFCLTFPLMVVVLIAGILWFVSFGHIVLVKPLAAWLNVLGKRADEMGRQ